MEDFKFKINGNAYVVSVEETAENLAVVVVNGKSFSVEIEKNETEKAKRPAPRKEVAAAPRPIAAQSAAPRPAQGGSNAVKAPIPGVIFKIEVSVGQAIKRGDVLLVMESMKMENNILAKKDGTIKAVYVQLGQTVLQGDVMIDVE